MSDEKQDYFDFLKDLRESGETNMFGAASFLEDEFPELNRQEAKAVLMEWMKSFEEEVPTARDDLFRFDAGV